MGRGLALLTAQRLQEANTDDLASSSSASAAPTDAETEDVRPHSARTSSSIISQNSNVSVQTVLQEQKEEIFRVKFYLSAANMQQKQN
jgi:hypothetical protein